MTRFGAEPRRHGAALPYRYPALASGCTDAGIQRDVNEDRFHVDADRGLYIVIDGIGGQAAGGKAADVALSMLRERLERETGPVSDRIREAITIANNEIYRLAATRAEWEGMACVLTVAVVENGLATIGHVGDTRLYKIHRDRIEKLTRDHSPVGEREDAHELSEFQAMRHPRRNEVYRDVGSEPHDPSDGDFIDVDHTPFEPDAAMLLCSDGLTDLVDSSSIGRTLRQFAGDPDAVVRALIDSANAAGGKDNVTAVYVEGERFATSQSGLATTPLLPPHQAAAAQQPSTSTFSALDRRRQLTRLTLAAMLLAAVMGVAFVGFRGDLAFLPSSPILTPATTSPLIVKSPGSISDVMRDAAAGSEIIVEPGEYREQLILKDQVRLVSRVPRGASIRLPATVSDAEAVPAVVAQGLARAELVGFKISGDSATPLAVGISVRDSFLSIVDVEITGATKAAVEFSGSGASTMLASEIRDNPGAALIVRDRAVPRISHNAFMRNGTSERTPAAIVVEAGSTPVFFRNVFLALNPDSLVGVESAVSPALKRDNWFVPLPEQNVARPAVPRQGQRNR